MIDQFIGDKPKGLQDKNFDEFTFTTAKVVDVILNSNHPDYKKLGGNSSLGAIKYEILKNSPTSNKNTLTYALPLLSFIKSYPLIGETVLVLNGLPTVNSGNRNTITFSYYLCDVNLFNTPHINFLGNPYKENKYFKEKNEFHPLFALEGDRIIEGRNNQTLRFTTDKEGFPKVILRATNKIPKQSDKSSFIEEDVNVDDGILIFSSNGKIPIDIAYGNLASYNINISNGNSNIISTNVTNKPSTTVANSAIDSATLTPLIEVKTVEKEKELFQISLEEVVVKAKRLPSANDQDDFNIPDYTFEESDKFGLEIINIADYRDFDQILYEQFLETGYESKVELNRDFTTNSENIITSKVKSISQGAFENYLGTIRENIPIQIKAMMETMAYFESNFQSRNGYDIIHTLGNGHLATIANWNDSDSYSGGHPATINMWYKEVINGKVFNYNLGAATASGRYQFINETWKRVSNKTKLFTFSRKNQNLNTDYLIRETINDKDYFNLHNIMVSNNDEDYFRLLKKLSTVWDIFPYGNSSYSYYTLFGKKTDPSKWKKAPAQHGTIKNLYQRAYNFYSK